MIFVIIDCTPFSPQLYIFPYFLKTEKNLTYSHSFCKYIYRNTSEKDKMICWRLIVYKINDLKKHPKNPRTLSNKQFNELKASIHTFGLIDKPIINFDLTIIGGHQRIQVLKKDKIKEVECWIPDRQLTEKEVEELMLRLNRNHGEFNYDDLANNFDLPDLLDIGFTVDELHLSEDSPPLQKKKKEKLCPHCQGVI